MAPRFRVPKCVEDLMELPNDDEDAMYAQDVVDIDSLDAAEMQHLVAGLATELADKEVFCVLEQSVFDKVFSLVRGYVHLGISPKSTLIDSLCSNCIQLNASTTVLIDSIDDSAEDFEDAAEQSRAHSNAIKIYAYFLCSILIAEEAEQESPAVKSAGSRGGSKGRSRKKHVPEEWDWSSLRGRCLRALAGAFQNDLKKIFDSPQLDESLITFVAKAAFKMFENRAVLEKGGCKQSLFTIVAACTIRYGYGISSVVTIIDMLHKFEHLPAHIADLVVSAENQFNGSSLAVDLLRSIGKIDPENFEKEKNAADNVGLFLEELGARLPKIMLTNLSVILCHLDGKSYKMRNSIVKVVGRLLVEAVKNADGISPNDVTRLRNEQRLLNILIERSRDISAYTRKHVLQTWAYLCKEKAFPIGQWNLVADIAKGRLEDTAANVRKNAVQLLATLLEQNPFGPSLRAAAFEATFEKYTEKLSVMSPRNASAREATGQDLPDMERAFSADKENEAASKSIDGAPGAPDGKDADSQPEHDDRQARQSASDPQLPAEIGGLEHTRALVASLESALRFSKCIGSTMETLSHLLQSSTLGDVESTIQLLILCKKFEVDGAVFCLRKTLPLAFSQEAGIKSAVEEAFKTLYLKGTPFEVASNLINLTVEASLGDLASIEELVNKSMLKREISAGTVSSLWDFFTFNSQGSTADRSRAALTVLCMAAKSTPQILSSHLQNILDIGFGRWAKDDVLLARWACIALQRLPYNDRASFKRTHKVFSILSNLIVRPGLPEACWYSASEQAINAVYALHPAPESFSSALLVTLARSVFSSSHRCADHDSEDGDAEEHIHDFSTVSVVAASHFLFAVAQVALKHLVYIESCLKLVRKQRHDTEKIAANTAAEESLADAGIDAPKDGNIAAELGLAASEDAKLDDLATQAETEIISGDYTQTFLVGAIAPMVSVLCSNLALMRQDNGSSGPDSKSAQLKSSALLALCKLMVIDARFCEKHLRLLFTVAQNSLEDSVRSNCVVALGDLALRFPNLVDPWMESFYARVHDQSNAVRKNTVLVLSHLILNDLIKVRGYVSEMAMHLEDEDPRISDLVKLFFQELAKKGKNPINNLLPDILSRLSSNPALSQDHFNLVMQFLIGTIKTGKQVEGLVERFCSRFVGISDARQWQNIAYCLSQLTYSLGCLKRLADHFKLYQHALGDAGVISHFKSLIAKTRKLAPADVKLLSDELEEKIMNCHNEMREQEEALEKAQEHHLRTEALKARSTGELSISDSASQLDELEAHTEESDSAMNGEQREAMSVEITTVVKQEQIDEVLPMQNASTSIQSNDVEGDDEHHSEIKANAPTSEESEEEEEDGDVSDGEDSAVDDTEDDKAQHSAEHGDSGELKSAVLQRTSEDSRLLAEGFSALKIRAEIAPSQVNPVLQESSEATASTSEESEQEEDGDVSDGEDSAVDDTEDDKYGDSRVPDRAVLQRISEDNRLLAEGFSAIRIRPEIAPSQGNPVLQESSEVTEGSCEEDSGGTQPYPYMDLDLESARTQEPPGSARSDKTHVKEEILDDSLDICGLSSDVVNNESHYIVKEYPSEDGYRHQATSSPFIAGPPSLESPQAARTSTVRRLKKGGVNSQKTVKSFPVVKVKQERLPQDERIVGRSRVLRPLNEKGSR